MSKLRVLKPLYLLFFLSVSSLAVFCIANGQEINWRQVNKDPSDTSSRLTVIPASAQTKHQRQEPKGDLNAKQQPKVRPKVRRRPVKTPKDKKRSKKLPIRSPATHHPLVSQHYLKPVQQFAEVVLQRGRDVYGSQKTPLFVDGLHRQTYAPVQWQYKGQVWVLSNFASQQTLLRTLDGLTILTRDPRYRDAAEQATGYALKHLSTPSGLLNWGGHRAWDLSTERAVYGLNKAHELKHQQPYFSFMWRVNPAATQQLIRGIWGAHLTDWSRLDFDRHGQLDTDHVPQWTAAFRPDVKVPFPTTGQNLSAANTVTPLLHAAATLATQDRNHNALTWTRRLAYRWQQAENPSTGLSGGQISYLGGGRDRAYAALGHRYPDINEANLISTYHRKSRYYMLPLAQMQVGEELVAAGQPFSGVGQELIQWASEDLKAFAQHVYDPATKKFKSLLSDGTPIDLDACCQDNYYGRNPKRLKDAKPNTQVLWTYAAAYRHTKDPAHWEMVRQLAKISRLGDLGQPDGSERVWKKRILTKNWRVIYAALELYYGTGDLQFLQLATIVADNILAKTFDNGLFPRKKRAYARTGDEIPLALLHLAAAIEGKQNQVPKIKLDQQYFHSTFDGVETKNWKSRTYDSSVFYGSFLTLQMDESTSTTGMSFGLAPLLLSR